MLHKFRKGLEISLKGAPEQAILPGNRVASVALFGEDFPAIRTKKTVVEGQRVARGDSLFFDRKRPEIVVTAPVSGIVESIETGPQRRLSVLRIVCEGDEVRTFSAPDSLTRESVTALCLVSGLWPAFLQRPYGRVPDPGMVPDAIFVTAMETDPLSADAHVVIDRHQEAFQRGIAALPLLTDGPVYVCQAPGSNVCDTGNRVQVETFMGAHPAGLAGTHIDRLHPIETRGTVWQIHYQDVTALGNLLQTGTLPGTLVIALSGPGLRQPRLIEAPKGAALTDLVTDELTDGPVKLLSGSPLSGCESSHLRRRNWQVSVLPRTPHVRATRWAKALPRLRPAAAIPTQALTRAIGPDLPTMPLIRALSVGDTETAERMGCRALLEEDLAVASYAAGNGQDFGKMLRRTLDLLELDA